MSPSSPGGSVHSALGVWKGLFQTLVGGSSTSTCPQGRQLGRSVVDSFPWILIPTIWEMVGDWRNPWESQGHSEVCQRSRKPRHPFCHSERKLAMLKQGEKARLCSQHFKSRASSALL